MTDPHDGNHLTNNSKTRISRWHQKHSLDLNHKYCSTLEDTGKADNDHTQFERQKWENHLLSIMADFVRRCITSASPRGRPPATSQALRHGRKHGNGVVGWAQNGSTSAKTAYHVFSTQQGAHTKIKYDEESGTRVDDSHF
ncbi:hypothetical protein GHT06_018955 [Daphnia sinensis]|uniref:Uncharacterized protein n=1 Tax=Daphnia sinensis TaxID=1820382 RepID=A0AAD5PQR8_9CRUS|nr:hypothetical protein GHT06_018955 [Daphnia sinensis]